MLHMFRASFDGSLQPKTRRKARVAAVLVAGASLIAIAWAGVAALNYGSGHLTEMAKAGTDGDVRVVGADGKAGKPCEEQTWPYIDNKCLSAATPDAKAGRNVPKHGLASGTVAVPKPAPAATVPAQTAKAPAATASPATVGSTTAIVPTPPVSDMIAGTTGSAPAADPDDSETAEAQIATAEISTADIPLPRPRPEQVRIAVAQNDAPAPPASMKPDAQVDERPNPMRRDSYRKEREEGRDKLMLEREAEEEARQKVQEDRRRARQDRRSRLDDRRDENRRNESRRNDNRRDENRIVRRWTEYTYQSPYGSSRRVIVIRRGSPGDDFFRTIR